MRATTLVAIAALAATGAFAQSSVQIIGTMDAGYQSMKYFGQSTSLVNQNGARTSAIKFTGAEDLGGGLKAAFMYEIDPLLISGNGNNAVTKTASSTTQLTTSTALNAAGVTNVATQQAGLTGGGEQRVGLQSAQYGEIQFGTPNTATLSAFGVGSMGFNTAVGSGYGATGIIFADLTRIESATKYLTPVFNGFQASYLYGSKNDAVYGVVGTTSQTTYLRRAAVNEFGLSYANGPLTVHYAHLESQVGPNNSSTATKNNITTKYDTLGVNYDFGVAKVGYTMQNVKADNTVLADNTDTKAQAFAVSVPFGASRIMLKSSSRKKDAGASALVGQKSTMTGLALEHDLSKNTFVYFRNESAKFNDVAAGDMIVNNAIAGAATAQLTDPKRTTTIIGISTAF